MEKSSRATVFIAIAICIVSIGCSVYFYTKLDDERHRKEEISKELAETKAQLKLVTDRNQELARQMADAKSLESRLVEERRRAEENLEIANRRILELETDLEKTREGIEVADKIPEDLVTASADLTDIEKELERVREEKFRLEVELQRRTGEGPESVDIGTVKVHTGKRFAGNVLVVNQRYNFVVIDLGRDHGMETGVVLILHRGRQFLGKVVVEKVYEKMSAATLLPDWMQGEPEVGDGVRKF